MKYKRILEKKEMRKKIVGWIVIFMGVGMLILPDTCFFTEKYSGRLFEWYAGRGDYKKKSKQ